MPTGSSGNSPSASDLQLNRPFSTNGLPTGTLQMSSVTASPESPVDYYIEALPGERLSVARVIIYIRGEGNIANGEYGDQAALINGVQLFLRKAIRGLTLDLDLSDGFPIMANEDWGRWNYDAEPVAFGVNTPFFRSRWTFSKYGKPILLNEGERLGVRFRDNIDVADHTIIAEGMHLGTPSPDWTILLDPPLDP